MKNKYFDGGKVDPTQKTRDAIVQNVLPSGSPLKQSLESDILKRKEQEEIDRANMLNQPDFVTQERPKGDFVADIVSQPQRNIAQERDPSGAMRKPEPEFEQATIKKQEPVMQETGLPALDTSGLNDIREAKLNQATVDTRMDDIERQEMQRIQKEREAVSQQYDQAIKDYGSAEQELKDMRIKKKDIWKDASTGQKIILALGAIFSSANNQAAQSFRDNIDKAIETDIALQKQEIEGAKNVLGSKKNTLDTLAQKLGSITAAESAMRSTVYKELGDRAKRFADTANSSIAAKNALNGAKLAYAKAEQEKIKAIDEASKKQRSLISFDNRYEGQAATEKEAIEFREKQGGVKSAMNATDQLLKIANKPFSSWNPEDRAIAEQQLNIMVGRMNKAITGGGILTEEEVKRIRNAVGDPAKLFAVPGIAKKTIENFRKSALKDLDEDAKSKGFRIREIGEAI